MTSAFSDRVLNNLIIQTVVVLTVKTLVVLQEFALRVKLHALAQAAEVEALYLPIVLIHAVPTHSGLFKELLRAVSTHESLKAVTTRVTAMFSDVLLQIKDILAHPAHPGLLCFERGRLDCVLLDCGLCGG